MRKPLDLSLEQTKLSGRSDVDSNDRNFNTLFARHAEELPTFLPRPTMTGVIRQKSTDFQVFEHLSFTPSEQGEHLFLLIEKCDCNTEWVAKQLQKHFNLRSQDIGYAGKKDRHSISQQWFSCHIPGKETPANPEDNDSFKIIKTTRHNKKLRVGSIAFNQFKLVVRELNSMLPVNELNERIAKIKKKGFPNYFGYQRFGHNGNNLVQAERFLNGDIKVKSRDKRGLYLSAARSFLFNLQVALRIKQQIWDKPVSGDCFNLAGSQSYFVESNTEINKTIESIEQRLKKGDIHISGWLPGKQNSQSQLDALSLENDVLDKFTQWVSGLKDKRVDSARRAMRVIPQGLAIKILSEDCMAIDFSLPSGSYATCLLRELINVVDVAGNYSNRLK